MVKEVKEKGEMISIRVNFNRKYATVYQIPKQKLVAVPKEGEHIEMRWDEQRSNIELYYNDEKLVK